MKISKLSLKYIVSTIFVLTSIIMMYQFFSLRNMTTKMIDVSRELYYLNVILDNNIEDIQIKKRIMGCKFKKSVIDGFNARSNQEPNYYIVILEGIMIKNSDLIKLTNYLTSQFNKNDVQIIACVSEMKTLFFKNQINNDNVYITSLFYSKLIERVKIGIQNIPILLLDKNGVCIYTFLFHYNCFTQVIENGKIISLIINSNKYECKN